MADAPIHLAYRPAALDDVIGQDRIVESLRNLLRGNGVPHAFLFTGPSGCGKTTLARIIASELGAGKEGLIEIDAATNSGIDAMRAVLLNVQYRALGSEPTKFVIVDECHSLSKATWQSLLKSIEEPPPHVYWALCTTEAHKVPKTIVTRCHTYQVKPVPSPVLGDYLEEVAKLEKWRLADGVVQLCTSEAGGSVRQALVNLSMARGAKSRKEAVALLEAASLQDGEAVQLARMLVDGSANWDRCVAFVKDLPDSESAESVRLVVLRYVQTVLLGDGKKNVGKLLAIVENFSGTPFLDAEDKAPLLLAIGRLLA